MIINFKKTNGITLIALVVTIIILLILANVTISLLIGDNGILNQATKSREQYEEATYKEKIYLARGSAIADLKRDITIDEWIKRIYNENIVSKNSITKTSEYSAKVVTPEGYVIYIHDSNYDKTVDPDEPVIVLGDDKIIIDNTEIPVLGDIKSDLEKPGNEWGKNYLKGVIFKYNDEYYMVKYD